MNLHKQCINCNSAEIVPYKRYYNKGIVKCKNCGLLFMEKNPSIEELDAYYGTYTYNREEYVSPITVKSYGKLLDEFEKYRKTNKILDVGCGRGWFLVEAKKRGWEVFGTEYGDTAVNLCLSEGIAMKKGKLNPADFDAKSFDIITSFEVLEHITNHNEELSNIYTLLRNGGLFYCTTPNFNALLRYKYKENDRIIGYPEHLTYFTSKTLSKIVTQNGFSKKKIITTGISFQQIANIQTNIQTNVNPSLAVDESVRQKIDQHTFFKFIKYIANKIFTLTNTGVTLKGYFVKLT